MTQPNPPRAGFPDATPRQPWLDRLRQGDAPPAGGPAKVAFTRGVLAAWDKEQGEAQDGARTPEPWLEQLAASAHAPKSEAFVHRTLEAFAAFQANRRIRRRTLGRLAFGAAALAAAAALAVGLRPWETMTTLPAATPPVTAAATTVPSETPAVIATPVRSFVSPLQAAAQGWLDRQSRQMQQHVTATFSGAKTRTDALLTDYAVPVHVSRLLLAPAMPAILPGSPAAESAEAE